MMKKKQCFSKHSTGFSHRFQVLILELVRYNIWKISPSPRQNKVIRNLPVWRKILHVLKILFFFFMKRSSYRFLSVCFHLKTKSSLLKKFNFNKLNKQPRSGLYEAEYAPQKLHMLVQLLFVEIVVVHAYSHAQIIMLARIITYSVLGFWGKPHHMPVSCHFCGVFHPLPRFRASG